MQQSDSLLLIFVKHPVPGKVKTRLGATLGHKTAVAVYQQLLEYTCSISESVKADKAIWYGNDFPEEDLWSKAGYPRFGQEGDDLGARMQQAFEWGFAQAYKKIQIIGSDCASLTSEIINEGFSILDRHDFVIGPAEDGGYYLLGMNTPYYAVFRSRKWSTPQVLADTVEDLRMGGKNFLCLPTLSDVDTEADLIGTFLEPFLPTHS